MGVTMVRERPLDMDGTIDRPFGMIETGENAITDVVDRIATVLAKHVSARHAARSASIAVQVLASAGAQDGHVVARAYRDAKLMEIIEGSTEICQTVLAEHALAVVS